MTGEGLIYVYGVVPSDAKLDLPREGVGGATTRVVESNGLSAVVSDVAGDRFRVRRRDLHAHLAVLEQVFSQTTVLPFRFGTVVASEEGVRTHLLEKRAAELRQLVERFEGRSQLNVKASYDEAEVLREVVASNPEIAKARARADAGAAGYYANIRVGELVAAALAERRARDAAAIHASLDPLAEQVASEGFDGDELLVLKAFFLVDRAGLDRFDSELERLAEREAPVLRFESFGPLPPAAFVSLGETG